MRTMRVAPAERPLEAQNNKPQAKRADSHFVV
jgi:hypothetical protein